MTSSLRIFLIIITLFSAAAVVSAQTDQRQEHLAKAARLVEEIRAGEDDPAACYNAACHFALGGDVEKAFEYLAEAIERGFANHEHLKKDTDLAALHADKRWPEIVARTETKQKEIESAFYNRKDFWDNSALKTAYRADLGEDEKIAGLSKLWSEAKYNFVNFDLIPDVDWDALYLAYIPKVRQTKTTLEYYRVLTEFGARLRDGHTGVYMPKELADEVYARPMLRTRLIEDKVLIVKIGDESLKRNGLEEGQEIVEIDGVPVKRYAEEKVRPYASASTPQDLETRMFSYGLLAGSAKAPVELTLRGARGEIFKRTLPRAPVEEQSKNSAPVAPMEFKMLPGNVAYIALNTFGDSRAAEMFAARYDEISRAEAIVFDVRENGGGNSSVGWNILAYLTDRPFATSQWYTRQYRPAFRAWERPQGVYGQEQSWRPNGKHIYTKPVVVLTSARTYSAAEDFTLAFGILKRGTIIGETTGGSTGQPLFVSLPGGGTARICTKRDRFPDGRDFVGKGIAPDKTVKQTVDDFRAGRDAALEAALRELKK